MRITHRTAFFDDVFQIIKPSRHNFQDSYEKYFFLRNISNFLDNIRAALLFTSDALLHLFGSIL